MPKLVNNSKTPWGFRTDGAFIQLPPGGKVPLTDLQLAELRETRNPSGRLFRECLDKGAVAVEGETVVDASTASDPAGANNVPPPPPPPPGEDGEDGADPDGELELPPGWADLNSRDTQNFIRDCDDPVLLERLKDWEESEKDRAGVHGAIETRLQQLDEVPEE